MGEKEERRKKTSPFSAGPFALLLLHTHTRERERDPERGRKGKSGRLIFLSFSSGKNEKFSHTVYFAGEGKGEKFA